MKNFLKQVQRNDRLAHEGNAMKHIVRWLFATLLLAGCASDEELFAQYDKFCSSKICLATLAEVSYTPLPPDYTLWEPAVYFGFDKHHLIEVEYARLDRNIKVLEENPGFKVSVRGFTDSFNSQAYNLALADRRQNTVATYLLSKGIAEDRIIATKAGELLPIKDSEAEEDRILNRRVEMLLLDETGRPLAFGVDLERRIQETFNPPLPTDREWTP